MAENDKERKEKRDEKRKQVPSEIAEKAEEGFSDKLKRSLRSFLSNLNPVPSRPSPEIRARDRFGTESLSVKVPGKLVEKYSVGQAQVFIYRSESGRASYGISEPSLSEDEQEIYQDLLENFFYSLGHEAAEEPGKYLEGSIWDAAYDLGLLDEVRDSFAKYKYFLERDAFGFGKLHVPMEDGKVEEITINEPGDPAKVIHRDHTELGWLKTNIRFRSEEALRNYNERIAQRLGKNLTAAEPIVDATTQRGDRLSMTFGDEVTQGGSVLTVRKRPEEPMTLAFLVSTGTLSSLMAAYLWQVLEWRGFLEVIGPVGSGKSISSEEPAMVFQDGVPKFESFSRLWSDAEGEDIVEAPTVRAKNPNTSVLSMEEEQCSWREADAFIKLSHDGEGRRVVLEDGREIVTTPDHSLVVLDENGNHVKKRPDEVGKEDMIPVLDSLELPSSPPLKLSDLVDSLPRECKDRIYVPEESVDLESENLPETKKKIAEMMGYESPSSLRGQRKFNLAAAEKAWEKTDFPEKVPVESQKHATGQIVLPDTLEKEEFARLLGEYIADGYYDGKRCVISGGDIERTAELVRALGVEPIIVEQETRVDKVDIPVVLTALIKGLGCGDKVGEKSLPEIYWRMDKEWRMQLLGSYLGRESYVSGKDVEVSTRSYELSRQLLMALLEADVSARRRVKKTGGNEYYRLIISHYFATELLDELELPVKEREGLSEVVESRRFPWSKYHVVPWRLLKKNESEAEKVGWFLTQKLERGSAVSKKKLRKVLEEKDPDGELESLWSLAESNLTWMPIDRVERCEVPGKVYDFSVSPSETFLAGDGVVVSNTTLMNAVLGSMDPATKRITIEETLELNLPDGNWQSFKTREVGPTMGDEYEYDLFDLVKTSMRHRPDFLAVGEVRGEEMEGLVHAASLGHSACSTLHADSPEHALTRLRTAPIDLDAGEILLIWAFALTRPVRLPSGKMVRRVASVYELVPDEENEPILHPIFEYDPKNDTFSPDSAEEVLDRSERFQAALETRAETRKGTIEALKEKQGFLEGLVEKGETGFDAYEKRLREFYRGE